MRLDPATSVDQAIAALKQRKFDSLVVSARLIPKLLNRHGNLSAGLSLPLKQRFRWAIRKDRAHLHAAVDDFFRQHYRSTEFKLIAKRYERQRHDSSVSQISPFDTLIKTYAQKYDFDWRLIAGRAWHKPWMLAGGLDACTVGSAITATNARQVDVASGVESGSGVKDAGLIAAFINAAQ